MIQGPSQYLEDYKKAEQVVCRGVPRVCMYRIFILVVTFLSYVCYHMSRKPISVVKPELLKCPNETAVEAFKASQLVAFTSGIIPSTSDLNCTSFIREMN